MSASGESADDEVAPDEVDVPDVRTGGGPEQGGLEGLGHVTTVSVVLESEGDKLPNIARLATARAMIMASRRIGLVTVPLRRIATHFFEDRVCV